MVERLPSMPKTPGLVPNITKRRKQEKEIVTNPSSLKQCISRRQAYLRVTCSWDHNQVPFPDFWWPAGRPSEACDEGVRFRLSSLGVSLVRRYPEWSHSVLSHGTVLYLGWEKV